MPLPKNIIDLLRSAECTSTIATIDAEGNIDAAPWGPMLRATPDGSMIVLATGAFTVETPKRLEYMKQAGKQAVVVSQILDTEGKRFEAYTIWCEVGDAVTSGPLFEKTASEMNKVLSERYSWLIEKPSVGTVWTLRPIKHKSRGSTPDKGKVVSL